MTLLGLSAGNPGGSAEILLKEALRASGATVELVRLHDLRLQSGPGAVADDAQWFWDRLMESDGLIVSSPIYTRTIPGLLRLLGDKISGPQSDVAFTAEILRMRAAGETLAVDFAVDERVLRPRVAGFLAVGGSLPTRWKALALPLMHTLTASAQIAVVDQVAFAGAGSPASIVLDDAALARARRLGEAVGSQLGVPYDRAEYRGDPGLCPFCHLSVIEVFAEHVECATCGARGTRDLVFSPEESILSYGEKLEHFREVQQTAAAHAPHRPDIDRIAAEYADLYPGVTP
jgi:multimeric flavodoxin WrbA